MTFRARLLASTAVLGLAALLPGQAQAGLLGTTGQTVQAFYYNGVFASPEGELTTPAGNSLPKPLVSPVHYIAGSADGSTIDVDDIQIVITNKLSGFPFCVALTGVGSACTDTIDGFDFKFAGESITGVTVDPGSASGFLPATFTSHLGLQLIGPNEIRVDVTGDLPLLNDQLILDVTFDVPPPPPPTPPPPPPAPIDVPEPMTIGVLGSALAGLAAVRRRRKR